MQGQKVLGQNYTVAAVLISRPSTLKSPGANVSIASMESARMIVNTTRHRYFPLHSSYLFCRSYSIPIVVLSTSFLVTFSVMTHQQLPAPSHITRPALKLQDWTLTDGFTVQDWTLTTWIMKDWTIGTHRHGQGGTCPPPALPGPRKFCQQCGEAGPVRSNMSSPDVVIIGRSTSKSCTVYSYGAVWNPICQIYRSEVNYFKSNCWDTQTRTHLTECSTWTIKIVDKIGLLDHLDTI